MLGQSGSKNLQEFAVVQLKEKLRQLGLSSTGNKAELIHRLDEAYPNRSWMNVTDDHSEFGSETDAQREDLTMAQEKSNGASALPTGNSSELNDVLMREMQLLRREKEVMEREIDLMRRENEIMRRTPQSDTASVESYQKVSISSMRELLSEFNGREDSFRKWERQVLMLCTTYRLDDNAARVLISSKLKGRALSWFHSRPEHVEMEYKALLKEMKDMFDDRCDRLTLRRKFESRAWRTNETFSDYFHEKVILANDVPIDDNEIVDYIIDGIPDLSIQNQTRMQNFDTRTSLLEALKKVTLRSENKHFYKKDTKDRLATGNVELSKKEWKVTDQPRNVLRCYNCNKLGHISTKCRLPKREKDACYKCGESGHKAYSCNKDQNKEVHNIFEDYTREEEFRKDVNFEFEMRDYNCKLQIDTLLDTGSPISFIKESYIPKGAVENASNMKDKFKGINGSKLDILGVVKAKACIDLMNQKNVILWVVPDSTMSNPVVLGRDALKQFNVGLSNFSDIESEYGAIQEIMNIDIEETHDSSKCSLNINTKVSSEITSALNNLFEKEYIEQSRPEKPSVDMELKITLQDTRPFHYAPRRMSHAEKEIVRDILDRLLEKKIIRPSESEYASPVVLVKKKNGETRLCVDFRTLNKAIARDNYPLPLIEDQISTLQGKNYYSLLDLKDGFHHVRVANESIKYTAFVTPLGQFEYLKMPFGLKTAPSKFQRFVNQVLYDLIKTGDVVVYMDDILVATRTMEHHMQVLKQVFTRLVKNLLELRIDKCKFCCTEIEYLGYQITEKGISPTRSGVEAVANFPVPVNTKNVQSFLGLCSYFRKFIQDFSTIAKPLYDLLKKSAEFKFGDTELQVFEKLKSKLADAPVLSIYSPRDETELHCDASAKGFGAVLMQRKSDLKFHPVFYYSKRTSPAEGSYHSFELETLCIIYALKRFRVYLQGIKFKIVTDCNSLKLTLNKKDVNARIARWALELENYDYEIEHRAGERMKHVDALSRINNILVIEDNPFEFNLSVSQNKDPKVKELREKLENEEDSCFEMRNGIVYRKQGNNLLFYVPALMENHVIYRYHNEMGHLGVGKTCDVIRKNYWFPKLRDKVENHIQNCLKCIGFTPRSGKIEGYLHNLPKGNMPFETLHIDHYGPVDRKHPAKQYVFAVVDAFTKYTKLYATKTVSSREAINCLNQYFLNYSVPKTIISDRGSCFTSTEFEEFLSEKNVRHIKIATGSPKANGQVERVNRMLTPMLGKLVDNESGKYWYKVLDEVEYAINNTIHKSTGEKPSVLLFGVKQRGKVTDAIEEYIKMEIIDEPRDLVKMRENAEKNINKTQEYNKKYYDHKRKEAHNYHVGDYVMLRNFDSSSGNSKKLIPQYKGPYEIMKALRNDRYLIADVENHQLTQRPYQGVWEAGNLKPWRVADYDLNMNI